MMRALVALTATYLSSVFPGQLRVFVSVLGWMIVYAACKRAGFTMMPAVGFACLASAAFFIESLSSFVEGLLSPKHPNGEAIGEGQPIFQPSYATRRGLSLGFGVLTALLLGSSATLGAGVVYLHDLWRETEAQLVAANQARPLPPTPEEQFRFGLDEALSYRLRTYPQQPGKEGRIDIELSPLAQPPFVMGVQLRPQEGAPLERIYDASFQPLEPPIRLDFTNQLPTAGEKRETATLFFHVPQETAERLGATYIEKRIPLSLTSSGVRVAISDGGERVIAAIDEPKVDQEVNDRFTMKFTVRAPADAASRSAGRMLHLLIHPTDGSEAVKSEYFVAPFHQRVDELSLQENHFSVLISVRSILQKAADQTSKIGDVPTHFELLLVELPFQLLGWTVDRHLLDLNRPNAATAIRARCQVQLSPKSLEEFTTVPGP